MMVCAFYKLSESSFPLSYGFGMVYLLDIWSVCTSCFPVNMLTVKISPTQFNKMSNHPNIMRYSYQNYTDIPLPFLSFCTNYQTGSYSATSLSLVIKNIMCLFQSLLTQFFDHIYYKWDIPQQNDIAQFTEYKMTKGQILTTEIHVTTKVHSEHRVEKYIILSRFDLS